MLNGTVIRDDTAWHGHPDVAYFNNKLFIVYRESDRHTTAGGTSIKLVHSLKKISQFSKPITIATTESRYNCPRLSVINDELYIICDKVQASSTYIKTENIPEETQIELWKSSNGEHWKGPCVTNITGIVPDRICSTFDGKFLIATHTKDYVGDRTLSPDPEVRQATIAMLGTLVQDVWVTDDLMGTWEKFRLAQSADFNFCEASIFKFKKRYVALLRENSGSGLPAYMSVSKDGRSWNTPVPTRMFGCHRPVCGLLRSGKLLTTYREATYGFRRGYWAKNTFACLTRPTSIMDGCDMSIILPLDHDGNTHSDSGYTGWVQLPDSSIFIVNYITDDAPRPYIKWYRIKESDF